jgi:sterol desaturase/sphingolipid hydroxylase (fatty acid hydroxylase superfamily)
MKWVLDNNITGTLLFIVFFILYGLEFIIPLVRKRSRHFMSNIILLITLTAINLLFTSLTFLLGHWIEGNNIGLFQVVNLSRFWMIVGSVIILDFWAGYLVHFIFHQYAWLWQLHSIHHSDDLVDVTTTFRQHPLESLIRISFQLSGMVLLGIPVWVLLIYLTLSTLHAQIEHANISLPAKLDHILQYVFVTPNMHKVHHSKYQHETDSNYSNILSVWDRLFGTYKRLKDYNTIDYGLDYLESRHYTFWELITMPFRKYKL